MNKTKNVVQKTIILLLCAALILSIGSIIKSALIFSNANKPSSGIFSDETIYPTAEELLFPRLYVVLTVIITLSILLSMYFIISNKNKKDIELICFVNIILFIIIHIIIIIIESVEQEYSLLYSAVGLNISLINIQLLLNFAPILLLTTNNDETNEIKNNNIVQDNNNQTNSEESLMQEEIAKLKHQLKLKQLEEEYLELKKQLEPKTKAKTTKKEIE